MPNHKRPDGWTKEQYEIVIKCVKYGKIISERGKFPMTFSLDTVEGKKEHVLSQDDYYTITKNLCIPNNGFGIRQGLSKRFR